jgi:group I intron endonuclease
VHYLYRITNQLSGKVYLGQTINPNERWQQHKSDAKGKPKQYIHHAMIKYGINNFIYEIIASCKTQEDADETEILLINQYDSRNKQCGYNISIGGEHGMLGLHQSEEAKKKISEWHKGKKLSEETKQKISEANKGYLMPEEQKKKISEANKGKIITEEARKNMSQAQKLVERDYDEMSKRAAEVNTGKKRSPETIQKMITNHVGNTGKHHTNEAKRKIGEASKSRKREPMSEETKQKISEAKKGKPAPNKGKTWKIVDGKRVWYEVQ